jgi:uncharacterized cupin superfamily protein
MPKIDIDRVPIREGSSYPAPFDEPCRGRKSLRLGDAAGLTQFGVHLVRLAPNAWASQRHWHEREDEFVYVLEGELVLVEDNGETLLRAGDTAAWPAGVHDGHHLQNRSEREASFLVVGSRDDDDHGEYSDIDMTFAVGRYSGDKACTFRHKDGTPYT